jgi:RecA-family ATPase
LVEAAESIRRKTGATVLLVHHVNKMSIKDPERGQEAVRGASALVDGVRWVALLSGMSESDAKRNSVNSAEIGSYVQMVIAKSNYGKLPPKVWLKRSNSGVLQLKDLERMKEQDAKTRNEEVGREAISKLQRILEQNGPLPARVIEEQYGGKDNVLGILRIPDQGCH